MNETETLLKEYGLALRKPFDEYDTELVNDYFQTNRGETAKEHLLGILRKGCTINVEDVNILFEKLSISQKYNSIKPLIEYDTILTIYAKKTPKAQLVAQLEEFHHPEIVEEKILKMIEKEPERFNVSRNELKIAELFKPGKLSKNKVKEIQHLYWEFGGEVVGKDLIHKLGSKIEATLTTTQEIVKWYKKIEHIKV